ncbi:MAG: agmatinase family protein [Polyangiaceae bacterium]|nr:agmatinase family protein [Polyangiaceae bacterium]
MTTFDPSGPAEFDGIFGLPNDPDAAGVVLLPVPWEPTTSYRKGTAGGPKNIYQASLQVDLFDRENGRPYEAGIALLRDDDEIVRLNDEACALAQPIIDNGGAHDRPELVRALARVNELSDALNQRVDDIASRWLDMGKLVGLVGGDHSSPFGLMRAIARRRPGLGVLHFDAHADLRAAYEGFAHSHASIMYNVHEQLPDIATIVQVGVRDLSEEENDLSERSPRIRSFFDVDLAERAFAGEPFGKIASDIAAALPKEVYISFDIDGLEPALCPATGTPVPGGLSFREACAILRAVVASGRTIVGFDLNEVSGASEWDGIVGARILYKLIGAALRSRRSP